MNDLATRLIADPIATTAEIVNEIGLAPREMDADEDERAIMVALDSALAARVCYALGIQAATIASQKTELDRARAALEVARAPRRRRRASEGRTS